MSKSLALDSDQKKIDAYRAGFNYYTAQHINHMDPEPQDNANNHPYYNSYWIKGFQSARHRGIMPEDYNPSMNGGKSRKIRTRKSKRRKSYKRRR